MYLEETETVKAIPHNMVQNAYEYDHMVYIRLFEGCNLFCEHCFIPSNPKKISLEFYENNNLTNLLMINKVPVNSKLYLQWHGGEPTMLGPDYLRKAIEEVEKDQRFHYQHGIQTNLINFNKDTQKWVDLFNDKFNQQIGVSWDYGIRHLKNNLTNLKKSNEDFENIFWSNIQLAKKNELDLYMVVTVTKLFFEAFKNPFDFFELMEKNGIEKLNLERITKTGFARNSWEKLGLSNMQYSQYMVKFFRAYTIYKQNNLHARLQISPFDGLLNSVIQFKEKKIEKHAKNLWEILSYKNQGYGCWNGSCDTRFHTIDANGYKKGCTALNSETDNKNKVLTQTIELKQIAWINKSDNSFQEIRQQRQQSCQSCEFLSICSSGCLSVEKFDDSGECSGSKLLFNSISQTVEQINH